MKRIGKYTTMLVLLGAFGGMKAVAQHADTAAIKLNYFPKLDPFSSDMNSVQFQPPMVDKMVMPFPDLDIDIATKKKVFYKGLEWPTKPTFDPNKPDLKLGLKKPVSIFELIQDNPLHALYMGAAIVAGQINYRIEGINKEIEFNTKVNTYTRSNVPVSAKDPYK